MSSTHVGVIGLGLLGSALAARLKSAGFAVLGFDVDPQRRAAAQQLGLEIAVSAAAVVAGAQRIFLCLPTSDIVELVIAEIEPALRAGQTILDCTTGPPERAQAFAARLAKRHVAFLDATVVGSSAAAKEGHVTILAGGAAEAVAGCADLFAALSECWFHVGPSGDAARMKLVVNLVLGLNRAALAEALALAERWGLDSGLTLDVLRSGAAYSRAMDAKGQKMLSSDFAPQARLAQHLKDVELILAAGGQLGARLPLSTEHRRLLKQLVTDGYGELDNSAVIQWFRDAAP